MANNEPKVTESDTYLEEVKSALNKDKTRLGDVWRLSAEGLDAKQIAKELDVSTPGFVHSNRRDIKAIVEGVLPRSRSTAKGCASTLRGFAEAKNHGVSFSAATYSALQRPRRRKPHAITRGRFT